MSRSKLTPHLTGYAVFQDGHIGPVFDSLESATHAGYARDQLMSVVTSPEVPIDEITPPFWEHYSKFHVIEKKKSPLAASNASG